MLRQEDRGWQDDIGSDLEDVLEEQYLERNTWILKIVQDWQSNLWWHKVSAKEEDLSRVEGERVGG